MKNVFAKGDLGQAYWVSIPLRGIGYEKHHVSVVGNYVFSGVSIPLRGIGYEKRKVLEPSCGIGKFLFPSPCGELVMKNGYISTVRDYERYKMFLVSIPLRGIGYEKRGQSVWASSLLPLPGFHPLAGNWL